MSINLEHKKKTRVLVLIMAPPTGLMNFTNEVFFLKKNNNPEMCSYDL